MATLSKRRKARKAYQRTAKSSKPGEGKRFKALVSSLEASGASNPGAVAASIGRKKYGKRKMSRWASAGRKKHRSTSRG